MKITCLFIFCNYLDPPIVAKRLRFCPVSKQTRMICMRVEV
jgi:hypothetical protein